jgi:hypothetical protein
MSYEGGTALLMARLLNGIMAVGTLQTFFPYGKPLRAGQVWKKMVWWNGISTGRLKVMSYEWGDGPADGSAAERRHGHGNFTGRVIAM